MNKKKKEIKDGEIVEEISAPRSITSYETNPEMLIARAIDHNTSVDTMEKLLGMRRELKQEQAKEAYDRAMADFQAACPTIEKKKQGYNYKYAPLEDIVGTVKELLAKNGFSYTFDTDEAEKAIIIICKVKHIAGHVEVSKAKIGIDTENRSKMNISQLSGSAMTYGKRYAFINAFGILTGDEDTDAKSARPMQEKSAYQTAKEHPEAYKTPEDTTTPPEPISDEQKADIVQLLPKINKTMLDMPNLVKYVTKNRPEPIDDYKLMTAHEASILIDGMKRQLPAMTQKETTCEKCGAKAIERSGMTKGGKQYHGIFCQTEDKSHTRWLWN